MADPRDKLNYVASLFSAPPPAKVKHTVGDEDEELDADGKPVAKKKPVGLKQVQGAFNKKLAIPEDDKP